MPSVIVVRDELFRELGQKMTDEEFDQLCFEFGIELDDVTSEKEIVLKERGEEAAANLSEDTLYRIDIPANRYDLLCLEGLSQALRVFLGKTSPPVYRRIDTEDPFTMIVDHSTTSVRPFVVCAILRNITFTESSFKSFIELQEKLHMNICRRRTLVAIGTHDLDTIKGPFRYMAKPPSEIKFRSLNLPDERTAVEIMETYKSDNHLKHFLPILENEPNYPVIYDANDVVLSMPPIINGYHSRIRLDTRNVFIECTATDLTKAHITLHTIIAAFSSYCDSKFSVESVRVLDSLGHSHLTPKLDERKVDVSVEYVKRIIGIDVSADKVVELLNRMCLTSEKSGEDKVVVTVPITRSDVLHPCDVAEDVAIAYGYNNVPRRIPQIVSVAREDPLNKFSDEIRREIAQAGYTEVLTMILLSYEENFENLRKVRDNSHVEIANPSSIEFQLPRTSLLTGLLKTLSSNKKHSLPVKIFELGDVVIRDPASEVGARNKRLLSVAYSNTTSGFQMVHGVLDTLLEKLGFKHGSDYLLEEASDPTFFPGRQARIVLKGLEIGNMGIIHPEVLDNFDLMYPVSAFEIDIQKIYSLI